VSGGAARKKAGKQSALGLLDAANYGALSAACAAGDRKRGRDMLEWMLMPLKRYADFKGRSRRKEFWMFALFNAIVYLVLMGIMMAIGGGVDPTAVDPADPMGAYSMFLGGAGILVLLWALAVLVPTIAVTVRRFHDRDMSGWWYLGFIVAALIPLLNIISGIALIVLMALPGTPGPNRFGPDPKNPSEGAEVFA
jgi:uncharacterized membrane protein YhaH (DUF805 family)